MHVGRRLEAVGRSGADLDPVPLDQHQLILPRLAQPVKVVPTSLSEVSVRGDDPHHQPASGFTAAEAPCRSALDS